MPSAEFIVRDILDELLLRAGFDDLWESIDDETQSDIFSQLIKIVGAHI
jgi:hypothetical protein